MPFNNKDETLEIELDSRGIKEIKGKTKGKKGFLKQIELIKNGR